MSKTSLKESDFFKTSDLALAGTLRLFLPIEAIDRQSPQKACLLFRRNSELDELIEKYWRGKLKVEPQAFFNALREIKARIHSEE